MKSVYQEEQQIFTNDKENCHSSRTQPSTAIALQIHSKTKIWSLCVCVSTVYSVCVLLCAACIAIAHESKQQLNLGYQSLPSSSRQSLHFSWLCKLGCLVWELHGIVLSENNSTAVETWCLALIGFGESDLWSKLLTYWIISADYKIDVYFTTDSLTCFSNNKINKAC